MSGGGVGLLRRLRVVPASWRASDQRLLWRRFSQPVLWGLAAWGLLCLLHPSSSRSGSRPLDTKTTMLIQDPPSLRGPSPDTAALASLLAETTAQLRSLNERMERGDPAGLQEQLLTRLELRVNTAVAKAASTASSASRTEGRAAAAGSTIEVPNSEVVEGGSNGWKTITAFVGEGSEPLIPEGEWRGQDGQDLTVARVLQNKRRGFFVDLAANDAVKYSNTVGLEVNLNWSGLCVEANPAYLPGLERRRCQLVHAAVGRVDGEEVRFNVNPVGGWEGIIDKRFSVNNNRNIAGGPNKPVVLTFRTVSLRTLLAKAQAPPVIDYLSLDIEGAEAWVFEAFPWATYTFLTLSVERPQPALRESLLANGYVHLCDHGNYGDEFWVHPSLPGGEEVVKEYLTLPEIHYRGHRYRECRQVDKAGASGARVTPIAASNA